MTARKSTLRPRRRSSTEDSIPRDISDWFAGEREPAHNRPEVPWNALLPPYEIFLHPMWLAWKRDHPGARPPARYEHLDDPNHPRNQRGAHDLEASLRILRGHGIDADWMQEP